MKQVQAAPSKKNVSQFDKEVLQSGSYAFTEKRLFSSLAIFRNNPACPRFRVCFALRLCRCSTLSQSKIISGKHIVRIQFYGALACGHGLIPFSKRIPTRTDIVVRKSGIRAQKQGGLSILNAFSKITGEIPLQTLVD